MLTNKHPTNKKACCSGDEGLRFSEVLQTSKLQESLSLIVLLVRQASQGSTSFFYTLR